MRSWKRAWNLNPVGEINFMTLSFLNFVRPIYMAYMDLDSNEYHHDIDEFARSSACAETH